MKLIKFVPAVLSGLVLMACTPKEEAPLVIQKIEPSVTETTTSTIAPASVDKLTNASKIVVYACQNNKMITANYAFQGEKALAVNVVLTEGKQGIQLPTLRRDEANQDFTSFKSDKYVWNVENGFNVNNATTQAGGMLTEKGVETDNILAKLCDVHAEATQNANK